MSLVLLAMVGVSWALLEVRPSSGRSESGSSRSHRSPVFTAAHPTELDAIEDFFNWRPTPVQPIAFSHKIHLAKGILCIACHAGVNQGPEAGLPSVEVCMVCHADIATDKPEVKKVAAYAARGEDIHWQRVYGFSPSAHVKFNHAPHIRAGVNCSSCHGDMTQQTVAVRAVDLEMGYCINCHRGRRVSADCLTCHY